MRVQRAMGKEWRMCDANKVLLATQLLGGSTLPDIQWAHELLDAVCAGWMKLCESRESEGK